MAVLDFAKVKQLYDDGLWNITRIRNAVVMSVITPLQFFEITGEVY